jgi:hypothetical protein
VACGEAGRAAEGAAPPDRQSLREEREGLAMIKLIYTGGARAVTAFCDSCGQPIRDRRLAVVVNGPNANALFAHKGPCHESLEARHPTAAEGFVELHEAIGQVIANTGCP